jgi:alpha-glucosidase
MRVAHETGAPLMRPLAFHYERDADVWSWKDEYFFGAELLVAPILTEDTSSRSVYLPEGEWVEFETDQIVTGKKVLDVKAELDQIPVFVRKGSILPMMPLTMNLTQANHETLILHVYPTANGHADSFTVYQDDGQSMKYVKDDFTKTFVSMDGWVLSLAESNKLYAPKRYEIVFHLVDKPSGFSVNGERLEGWTYDADKKTASVRFESSLWVKDFKVGFQR